MMAAKLRLLIVEDEPVVCQGLADVFLYHGYEIDTANDGETAFQKFLKHCYDLIILDVILPARDGFSVCDAIRQRDRNQPIIMLTGRISDDDIVTGLSLGADDYIRKPFSVRELVARVEAVLRRSRKVRGAQHQLTVADGIVIDTRTFAGEVENRQEAIIFSQREVDLLDYLQRNADRPVSRNELLIEVWGYSKAAHIETRTVDIHVAKLRRKIESDPQKPRYLVTVRNKGYRLLAGDH